MAKVELDVLSQIGRVMKVNTQTFDRLKRESYARVLQQSGNFYDPTIEDKIRSSLKE